MFICAIFMMISTAVMFFRPDFVNMVFAILPIFWFLSDRQEKRNYRLLAFGLIVSELYDFIWFYCYAWHWILGQNRDEGLENFPRRMAVIFSIANFFFKLFVFLLMLKNSVDLGKKQKEMEQQKNEGRYSGYTPERAHKTPDRRQAQYY